VNRTPLIRTSENSLQRCREGAEVTIFSQTDTNFRQKRYQCSECQCCF